MHKLRECFCENILREECEFLLTFLGFFVMLGEILRKGHSMAHKEKILEMSSFATFHN